jgi:hypothetical protein
MSEYDAIFTDDEAALSFVGQLALQMIDIGEHHASLISNDDPTKKSEDANLIKANAMMVFSSLLLMGIVQNRMGEVAKVAAKLWTSPVMVELNQVAFHEEIQEATDLISSGIDDIENFLNKENNGSSSESGDGSSDI